MPAIDVTNVEKLSLPIATAVGTRVSVTDAFVVSGFGDARDGFYFPYGDTHNERRIYIKSLPYLNNGSDFRCSFETLSGSQWNFGTDNNNYTDGAPATDGSEDYPWQADWSANSLTLTHPAVQQLAAPSTAQGGVFVSGGTQDGVYDIRVNGSVGYYYLLGVSENAGNSYILKDTYIDISENAGQAWQIRDASEVTIYYSFSDVATPDLATNWKNASDDSPASITVTSVTAGLLAAGFVMTESGIDGTNDIYQVSVNSHGKNSYLGLVTGRILAWDGTKWGTNDVSTRPRSFDNTPTPMSAAFDNSAVITRDDVASEANWEVSVSAPSDNADLASLTVSYGDLVPAFDPAVTSYRLNANPGTTATLIAADAGATVNSPVTLGLGANPITVTAEDGVTTKTYTIDMYVAGRVRGEPDGSFSIFNQVAINEQITDEEFAIIMALIG